MKLRDIVFGVLTLVMLVGLVLTIGIYQANAQCPPTRPVRTPLPPIRETVVPVTDPEATRIRGLIQSPQATNRNLSESLANIPQLSTFYQSLQRAGMLTNLQAGNFTVIAPTNQAFDRLPVIPWRNLQAGNGDRLQSIIGHHLIQGQVSPLQADASGQMRHMTLSGERIQVRQVNGRFFLENSMIMHAYRANNGTIYVVDTVMIPDGDEDDFLATEEARSRTDIELQPVRP